jgi:3-hydroxymyristoyl/3-hydroxydecanoyl-(acyl carrier protein) dehydratase
MPIVSRIVVDHARRTLVCELLVPHDLPIFHGHFPAVPIVPGVTQVGWAVELVRQHGIAAGRCSGIVTAKFRRLVLPGMRLMARIEADPGAGQCQFTFELAGAAVSTGRLQFGAGHD